MKSKIKIRERTLAPENKGSARRKFLAGAAGALAGGAALVAAPNVSRAQTVTLKMQGAWGGKDLVNDMAVEYVDKVNAIGLDVYNNEPNIHPGYRELANAFLLPHIGSATRETRDAMGFRALDNMDAIFAGEAPRDRVA